MTPEEIHDWADRCRRIEGGDPDVWPADEVPPRPRLRLSLVEYAVAMTAALSLFFLFAWLYLKFVLWAGSGSELL